MTKTARGRVGKGDSLNLLIKIIAAASSYVSSSIVVSPLHIFAPVKKSERIWRRV
jgi:hypothetical protein